MQPPDPTDLLSWTPGPPPQRRGLAAGARTLYHRFAGAAGGALWTVLSAVLTAALLAGAWTSSRDAARVAEDLGRIEVEIQRVQERNARLKAQIEALEGDAEARERMRKRLQEEPDGRGW